MTDSGDYRFIKCPPAAAYDRRLRGFDLQVLLALAVHADFSTMETDHSGVQLAQDFNVARPAIVRAIGRLVDFGYLSARGSSSRRGTRYRINLGNRPPVTPVAQVEQGAPVTPVAQVDEKSPVTPVAQSKGGTCNTGGTPPVTPLAHSTEPSQKEKQQGVNDGSLVASRLSDFWECDLTPDDFLPGTTLVQRARDLGFARDDGAAKDALQAQRRAFFAYRANRGFQGNPKRRDFLSWLERAAEIRANVEPLRKQKFASGDAPTPNNTTPAKPKWALAFSARAPHEWRKPWCDVLDRLAELHTRSTVAAWFYPANYSVDQAERGKLCVVFRNADVARQAVQLFGDNVRDAWPRADVPLVFGHFDRSKNWRPVADSARSGTSATPERKTA